MPHVIPREVHGMESPVLLAQPVLHRVLSVFFPAVLATFIAYAALTDYSQSEAAKGEVTAVSGFSAVVADQSGIMSRLDVGLGDRVRRGQPIGTLSLPAVVTRDGDMTEADVRRIKASIVTLDRQAADHRRTMADVATQIETISRGTSASIASASRRSSLTADRESLVAKRLVGVEALAERGFVANATVDQMRLALLQLRQESADTQLAIDELRRARDDRLSVLSNRLADLRQATLALSTERLKEEKMLADLAVRQSVELVAPVDGVVSAISIRPGQRVESGMRMLAISQGGAVMTVALQVPSKAIGLVEKGQRVALKYDAFPYQSFGVRYGRVVHVGSASIDTARAAEDPAGTKRDFLVEVRPNDQGIAAYGRVRPLRLGMTLTADIEIERRSLLSWMLSPLLALKGRLS